MLSFAFNCPLFLGTLHSTSTELFGRRRSSKVHITSVYKTTTAHNTASMFSQSNNWSRLKVRSQIGRKGRPVPHRRNMWNSILLSGLCVVADSAAGISWWLILRYTLSMHLRHSTTVEISWVLILGSLGEWAGPPAKKDWNFFFNYRRNLFLTGQPSLSLYVSLIQQLAFEPSQTWDPQDF